MPTIAQLPAATAPEATDEIPISQGGVVRATTVGTLLASTQSAIQLPSGALLGRISVGNGSPETVEIGTGITLAAGTVAANGLDHGSFPVLPSLSTGADLVISNQGTPMLMQTSLLRELFSAGTNVTIDVNGTISALSTIVPSGTVIANEAISQLPTLSGLASADLVPVSHAGSSYAVSYAALLDGVTIDQAQQAAAAGNSDTVWVAQDSNVMARQTFSAIWVWITSNLPTYKAPVVEITANTNLDTTVHNGRILICSQPVTLTPLTANMGSGFQCWVINASSGSVTLGSGFVTSSGGTALAAWQCATICCATYSGGTIAFASIPTTTTSVTAPGQVTGLASSATTSSSVTVSWQAPASGGAVISYIVQYRVTGTSAWTSTSPVTSTTSYQISSLQSGTSYDICVQAENGAGAGTASAVMTVSTATAVQSTAPPQVTGVTATASSSTAIAVTWSAQTGTGAATSFTVRYRVSGTTTWSGSATGLTGTSTTISGLAASTSYDVCVIGVNDAGSGTASSAVTTQTLAAAASVTSITWNVGPSGPYTHGSGAIGVNAHVSPSTSAIQFGISQSSATPPTSWTEATYVNSDLWGAYLATPATAGTYYAWAEGLDGSATTVSSSFVVQ